MLWWRRAEPNVAKALPQTKHWPLSPSIRVIPPSAPSAILKCDHFIFDTLDELFASGASKTYRFETIESILNKVVEA
jgi:hypothetical protein